MIRSDTCLRPKRHSTHLNSLYIHSCAISFYIFSIFSNITQLHHLWVVSVNHVTAHYFKIFLSQSMQNIPLCSCLLMCKVIKSTWSVKRFWESPFCLLLSHYLTNSFSSDRRILPAGEPCTPYWQTPFPLASRVLHPASVNAPEEGYRK